MSVLHFSPIRRCVSAAKPARWPAKNGTAFRKMASTGVVFPTTTPERLATPPGGM